MALFTVLTALSTPLIATNAAGHYLSWSEAERRGACQNRQEIERLSKLHRIWNAFAALTIFVVGVASAGVVASLQTATPLILSAMAFRIVVIAAIAGAVWATGVAVNDLSSRFFLNHLSSVS